MTYLDSYKTNKSLAPKKNNLVFVMCNFKLNNNQLEKQANDRGVVLDDLSFDNDLIIEGKNMIFHLTFYLFSVIDSATQINNDKEDESNEEEISNNTEMDNMILER
jgi:hypothetical protein